MTISSSVRTAGPFIGSGSQTAFPFSFKVFQTSDLLAVQTDTSAVQTTLALGTNYTVALNADQDAAPGGTLTLLVALPASYSLTLTSAVPATQTASLTNAGGFFPKTVEAALDRLTVIFQQLGLIGFIQSLRVPEIGGIGPLPSAASRANTSLTFDAFGNPLCVVPTTGTAAALSTDLANAANVAKGPALIGVNQTLAYAAGTAGALLRNVGAPRALASFGALNNDGATDDSGVWATAAASGVRCIDARGLNCKIASAVNIPTGQVWLLDGTAITLASSTITVFNCATKADFALMGVFTITGDGTAGAPAAGTAKGIYLKDCSNYYIDRPVLRNIRGWGIYLDPDVSTSARSQHGVINNPRIDSCYYGWEDVAGTGAEYTTIIDPYVTRCGASTGNGFGWKTCAGNIQVTGGHIVDNLGDGVILAAGSNHGHGTFTGTRINHNIGYGIHATSVLNGHTFTGCHIYQNDVWFDQSKGIHILGGHFDPTNVYNYKGGSSGTNIIDGAYCPGGYGFRRTIGSNDGHDQLVIKNCWGPGSYAFAGGKDTTGVTMNDPANCYVAAQRDGGGGTQALTSGVGATLTWSATPPIPDRRLIANLGTGVFTIPTDQAGWYRIDFSLLFGGTAMSTTASFVEVKVNAVSKNVAFPTIDSTTKLQVQGSFEPIYLNGGDVVTIVGTITGTTPTFGDGAWPSTATIRRIA